MLALLKVRTSRKPRRALSDRLHTCAKARAGWCESFQCQSTYKQGAACSWAGACMRAPPLPAAPWAARSARRT
jgi:hypothetical protein